MRSFSLESPNDIKHHLVIMKYSFHSANKISCLSHSLKKFRFCFIIVSTGPNGNFFNFKIFKHTTTYFAKLELRHCKGSTLLSKLYYSKKIKYSIIIKRNGII